MEAKPPTTIFDMSYSNDEMSVLHNRHSEEMVISNIAKTLNVRKLTKESDLLHAFAGMSSYISDRYGLTFWNGLPIEKFNLYLHFDNYGCKRR
jgi:hypothetical protein